jgi:hypothetical protein
MVVYYEGIREQDKAEVYRVTEHGRLEVPKWHAVRNHSPAGFEWGYSGSGPAQLALALAMEVLPAHQAERNYQRIKQILVCQLPHDGWVVFQADLKQLAYQVATGLYCDAKVTLERSILSTPLTGDALARFRREVTYLVV